MERAEPLHLLKMLRKSVAYLLWKYYRNQFELAFILVLLLNRRMPNCTTVVQAAVTFLNPKFD